MVVLCYDIEICVRCTCRGVWVPCGSVLVIGFAEYYCLSCGGALMIRELNNAGSNKRKQLKKDKDKDKDKDKGKGNPRTIKKRPAIQKK